MRGLSNFLSSLCSGFGFGCAPFPCSICHNGWGVGKSSKLVRDIHKYSLFSLFHFFFSHTHDCSYSLTQSMPRNGTTRHFHFIALRRISQTSCQTPNHYKPPCRVSIHLPHLDALCWNSFWQPPSLLAQGQIIHTVRNRFLWVWMILKNLLKVGGMLENPYESPSDSLPHPSHASLFHSTCINTSIYLST